MTGRLAPANFPPEAFRDRAGDGQSASSARSAVTGDALRRFMRGWPTGLAVVTASADGRPAGCAVNAFVSVSLHPPLLLISLSEHSRTLSAITGLGFFGVNVLAGHQRALAMSFSAASDDRFGDVPYRWEHGVPVLSEATAAVVCEVDRVVAAADHMLVFGRPLWCACGGAASPLVFAAGAYYVLSSAERLGGG
jgi:3-hydroxy-9,10-secoandrosta-1,3,5(10)-triene-9,17-dione monooxygenase reductase component